MGFTWLGEPLKPGWKHCTVTCNKAYFKCLIKNSHSNFDYSLLWQGPRLFACLLTVCLVLFFLDNFPNSDNISSTFSRGVLATPERINYNGEVKKLPLLSAENNGMAASAWVSRTEVVGGGLTLGRAQQRLSSEGFGLGANGSRGQGLQRSSYLLHDTDKPVSQDWGKKMESCTIKVPAFLRGIPTKLGRRLSPNFQGEVGYQKISWSCWRDSKCWLGGLRLYLCFLSACGVWQGVGLKSGAPSFQLNWVFRRNTSGIYCL